MEIILLENVENLGRKGEIVSVKDGYARNFLVPSGRAVYVTAESLRRAELLKKKYIQEEMERRGELKELAAKLGTVSITIGAKASEEGHLFGSVGVPLILDALKEQGYEIEPKAVKLEENIKEVGVYSVPVVLHGNDIKADIKVWVVEEKEGDLGGMAEEAGKEASSGDKGEEGSPEGIAAP